MKKFLFLFLLIYSSTIFAQDFILRAGNEVYRYDEGEKRWSENPLPVNSYLNRLDSIKSYTTFTLEVPLSWKNFYKKRIYTYIKYPDGIRLNQKIVEKKDCYSPVDTRVIVQGDNTTLINHIAWIQNNSTLSSPINVEFDICDLNNWLSVKEYTLISKTTPVSLSIINKEPYSIYVYILWKDIKWQLLGTINECIRISPFSNYEEPISLSEPLGKQSVLLICSQELIAKNDIISLLESNHKAEYNEELGNKIGFKLIHFNIGK